MKLNLKISKKIYLGFGILLIAVILSSIATFFTMAEYQKLNERVALVCLPSVSHLNNLYSTVANTKMLIKTWVFIDTKENTKDKLKLKNIHDTLYPMLKGKLQLFSKNWENDEQNSFISICESIEDSLFPKHIYIMSLLSDFEEYNVPSNIFEASSMVEEDNDEVMLITNRILRNLNKLINTQEQRMIFARGEMKRSFDKFQRLVIFIGLLLIMSIVIIATYISRTIVNPIKILTKATSDLENNCLDNQIVINSGDELETLALSFNKMANSLQIQREKLLESNKELETEQLKLAEANSALLKSKSLLRELNSTKDKFFAILAHDLKNPLTSLLSITGSLSLNFQEIEEEDIIFYIERVHNNALQIHRLLENLLDWSISQPEGNEKPESIDIKTIIENSLFLSKFSVQQKNIKVYTEIDNDLRVFADKNLLKTIFRNLLSNAIKFNKDNGQIKISAKAKENFVEIGIVDTGIGISPENIQKLLNTNEKLTEINHKHTGTGLGWIISKEFVEKSGGKIWINSVEGVGSEFCFTIPRDI